MRGLSPGKHWWLTAERSNTENLAAGRLLIDLKWRILSANIPNRTNENNMAEMGKVQLGELCIEKVQETEGGLPMAFSIPQVTSEDLVRLREWYWDDTLSEDPETAMFTLSNHSYLLRVDGLNILIDTCNGNHKNRCVPIAHQLDTDYLENLTALGVQPEDIDMVLCTHLHADHVGWNTQLVDGEWVPTFPNARYIIGERDYQHFSTQTEEVFHHEAYEDSVLPIVKAGLAEIVKEDSVLMGEQGNGVWMEPAFGHSPGSCLIHAKRGGPQAVFSGDIFHHPVQLVRPDYAFAFDHDAEEAVATRQKLLADHVDSDTVFFPAHFRGVSAGSVISNGDTYSYRFLESE